MDGDGEMNWNYVFLGAPFFEKTEISENGISRLQGTTASALARWTLWSGWGDWLGSFWQATIDRSTVYTSFL
jgi:hypothetical protein